eukprot:gene11156-12156_t
MQYLSLKSGDGSESCNTKASKVKIASTPDPIPVSVPAHHDRWSYGIKSHREPYCQIDGAYNLLVPSLTHTLHFSTYGNNVEDERAYSSHTSLHGRFSCIRREQRFTDKSVMHNESTSMMRSFSSAKENDFLQPSKIISSSSLSWCDDEFPSYRTTAFHLIHEGERPCHQ